VAPTLRSWLEHSVMGRAPGILRRGPSTPRRVALTFDDGPDEHTPRYLALLDELGVPATFFVRGARIAERPAAVRAYLRHGHQIANHGYDHTAFTHLPRTALLDQLARTERAIGGQLTGRPWVRPPHGKLDPRSLLALHAAGYTVVLWSIDSFDRRERDPGRLAVRCGPAHVRAGDVLRFHEGQDWTLAALPRVVSALHASGIECVTLHDLFAR
jgi:peptidoglycan-N-acetylglucosamine deacetylase